MTSKKILRRALRAIIRDDRESYSGYTKPYQRRSWQQFKDERLQNPEVRAGYEEAKKEYEASLTATLPNEKPVV